MENEFEEVDIHNKSSKGSISQNDIFEILKLANLSKFVESDTQIWKVRLNHVIGTDEKVKEALMYIIDNYKKKRKNNPNKYGYIHCIEAASLMAEYWFCESDDIAAALLHDVWEDISDWEEYLKSTYNENIVNLVRELTEKDKSWDSIEQKKASREERKLEELEKVSHFSPKVLALKLADQTSNIAETVSDLEKLSPEDRKNYWKWFNAGYDKQIWKYKALSDALYNRIQICKNENLFTNENEEVELNLFFEKFKNLVDTLDFLMKDE